jgi:hypothetical protein
MRVWRVEHPDSRLGPWQHSEARDWNIEIDSHVPECLPTVHSDCGYDWARRTRQDSCFWSVRDYVCAVSSIKQLLAWFRPGHLKLLESKGFVVAEYDIHAVDLNVLEGSCQVAVKKSELQHIADYAPSNIVVTHSPRESLLGPNILSL